MKESSEFNELLDTIQNLTEDDAKSLLKIIYGYTDIAISGKKDDQVKLEVLDKILSVYKRIPDLMEIRENK